MPVAGVMVVGFARDFSYQELTALREAMHKELDSEKEVFRWNGPMIRIFSPNEGPVPRGSEGLILYDVNLGLRYYGKDYRGGYFPQFTRIAEWIERKCPEARIWYGHDVDDDNLRDFTPAYREELLQDYKTNESSNQAL